MSDSTNNTGTVTVFVEFPQHGGLAPVGNLSLEDQIARSQRAVEQSMDTIRFMAHKVQATIDNITDPPQHIEITFGITFNAEAGAVLAKAGMECSINVKLAWGRPA